VRYENSDVVPNGTLIGVVKRRGDARFLQKPFDRPPIGALGVRQRIRARCHWPWERTRRTNPDIWVEDPQDGSLVRVTTATGSDILPVWSAGCSIGRFTRRRCPNI
jgi:hypothetical protein